MIKVRAKIDWSSGNVKERSGWVLMQFRFFDVSFTPRLQPGVKKDPGDNPICSSSSSSVKLHRYRPLLAKHNANRLREEQWRLLACFPQLILEPVVRSLQRRCVMGSRSCIGLHP